VIDRQNRRSTQLAMTWREVIKGMVLQWSTLHAYKSEAYKSYDHRETFAHQIQLNKFLGLLVISDLDFM
jgi:hypothetical protein